MRTLSAQTPTNWAPPPQWTPPAHVPASSNQALRHGTAVAATTAGTASTGGCVITGFVLAVVGGVLAVVFAVVIPAVTAPVGGPSSAGLPSVGGGAASWDGSSPYTCGGNQTVTLSNVTRTSPARRPSPRR